MEEREIKLARGESYVCEAFKMIKGQTRFVDRETAKRLVGDGNGRFIYTANERGEAKIKCPFCKKEFELTDKVKVKQEGAEEKNEDEKGQEKKKDNENLLVCTHCLRDDFKNKAGLKSHMNSCEFNSTKKSKDGVIETGDVESPSKRKKK